MQSIDNYLIDSHKLAFHPRRVAAWLAGETVYPIYAEISPSGACNHRCTFCALDYLEYQPRFLDIGILQERLAEMGRLGLRSVMYGGEGEPLLHRDFAAIVRHTRSAGIDVGISTNGVLLTTEMCEEILGSTSWVKVSLNAGIASTYAQLHRTREADFTRVLANLEQAVLVKRKLGSNCTLGAQLLLLPENAGEVELLARQVRDLGLQYLVVKPYSQHFHSRTRTYSNVTYSEYSALLESLTSLNTAGFSVVFREQPMKKLEEEARPYSRCLALPFWTYIDAGGMVWGCSAHLGDERFAYGCLNEQTFSQIWHGERRQESLKLVATIDPQLCRLNCRMDEINRYLWELTHPGLHVNFI
jgi:wyosine [tRNA(Phe)-imidazoG37] synthetase (radical SAM superfamily)